MKQNEKTILVINLQTKEDEKISDVIIEKDLKNNLNTTGIIIKGRGQIVS